MPGADTIEKFMDSLSPLLRIDGRRVELALAEIADQFCMNVMQFYDDRRFRCSGKTASRCRTSTSIWHDGPGQGRRQHRTQEERAVEHKRNFVFAVMPNSFLNVSHTTKQLQSMQLFRSNALDPWSLWNDFDLLGAGKMPAETIAERIAEAKRQGIMPGPPPEVVGAQNQAMLLQMQMQITQLMMAMGMGGLAGGGQPAGGQPPPGGGQGGPPPAQVPNNNGVGPQGGRPPSGQAPPHMEQKSDGRAVVVVVMAVRTRAEFTVTGTRPR